MTQESTSGVVPPVYLRDVILFLKRNLKLLIVSTGAMACLLLLYSYTVTKMYSAQTILLPEYSSSRSSFWSMAVGASNSDGLGNLTPDVYPRILESSEFGLYLLEQNVTTQSKGILKLKDYLSEKKEPTYLQKLLTFLKSAPKGEGRLENKLKFENEVHLYDSQQLSLIRSATNMVSASIEQKNNLIIIESLLPDPLLAASLVEYSKLYLMDYIEDFRTAKVKQQYVFLEERVKEAKKKLNDSEYAYQAYRDRNRDSYLNVSRIQEQRLSSEYALNQNVYSELVSKLEQAKIRLKEERPVFKVLEPTIVPIDKSTPQRKLYLISGAIIGFIGALVYAIFFKEKLHHKLGI